MVVRETGDAGKMVARDPRHSQTLNPAAGTPDHPNPSVEEGIQGLHRSQSHSHRCLAGHHCHLRFSCLASHLRISILVQNPE